MLSPKVMILIVGGAGYIGSHLNQMLARSGRRTVVYDNLSTGHREFCRWGEFVHGDLGDAARLDDVFRRYPVEAVLHFAADAAVGESMFFPLKYYSNNVANTVRLLEAMNRHGVRRLIFSSSCAVYGWPQTKKIAETHPLNPVSPYGRSKRMVETMLEDLDRTGILKYVSLRYFNAAGADPAGEIGEWHSPETHLIPIAFDVALGLRPSLDVFGDDYATSDGTCVRDYIHVNDLARAHVMALDHLLGGGASEKLNLGNGHGFSVKQVIERASRVTGREIPFQMKARRPGDPDVLVGDATKAARIFEWRPEWTELTGILETAWKWHQALRSSVSNAAKT